MRTIYGAGPKSGNIGSDKSPFLDQNRSKLSTGLLGRSSGKLANTKSGNSAPEPIEAEESRRQVFVVLINNVLRGLS